MPAPSSSTAPPAGTPDKVYTDQELMAIINAVAQNRRVQGGAMDSQRLRSVVATGAAPLPTTATTPGECVVFAPRSPFAVWADKSVNMAEGGIPIAAQSGPTTTITLTIRSAEKGQIQGSNKMDSINLTVASMPTTAARPYPFDAVAATLRDCATIQEGMSGSTRPWSDLKRPSVDIAADLSYAVAYQFTDGSGERHVMVGARKGTLTVEANVIKFSDAEVQSGADGLAAMIGEVFARAGL